MSALGWLIALLLAALATAEFIGIARHDRGETDTITELVRGLRDKLPTPVRYGFMFLITGLLGWTILHFYDLV